MFDSILQSTSPPKRIQPNRLNIPNPLQAQTLQPSSNPINIRGLQFQLHELSIRLNLSYRFEHIREI